MTVRSQTFNGRRFKVVSNESLDGICYDGCGPEIVIDSKLTGKRRLETILHEAAHAEVPKLTEDQVTRLARSQAILLWRLGYRDIG